jgi:hypothetical protein
LVLRCAARLQESNTQQEKVKEGVSKAELGNSKQEQLCGVEQQHLGVGVARLSYAAAAWVAPAETL